MEYNLKDLKDWDYKIEEKVYELGLNVYPQEFEIVGFDEMLGYEAYVGMPSRYPHWSFGKSCEKTKTLYSFNLTASFCLYTLPEGVNIITILSSFFIASMALNIGSHINTIPDPPPN